MDTSTRESQPYQNKFVRVVSLADSCPQEANKVDNMDSQHALLDLMSPR